MERNLAFVEESVVEDDVLLGARERATELGFVEVFLRVDPDNEAAIPMYIGLDYSPTGDHALTTYESVDAEGVRHSVEQTDSIYRKSLLAH